MIDISKLEMVNYDGSYCPECRSENVEIKDSSHDFGWLELEITCNDCNCEYTSQIAVNDNKLTRNEVEIEEHGKTVKEE